MALLLHLHKAGSVFLVLEPQSRFRQISWDLDELSQHSLLRPGCVPDYILQGPVSLPFCGLVAALLVVAEPIRESIGNPALNRPGQKRKAPRVSPLFFLPRPCDIDNWYLL